MSGDSSLIKIQDFRAALFKKTNFLDVIKSKMSEFDVKNSKKKSSGVRISCNK